MRMISSFGRFAGGMWDASLVGRFAGREGFARVGGIGGLL